MNMEIPKQPKNNNEETAEKLKMLMKSIKNGD